MGDFRRNILQTDFGGKKLLQGNTWVKKYPTLKKKRLQLCMSQKNLSPERFGKNNLYPNQVTHTPSQVK